MSARESTESWLESHLATHEVAHVLYGTIVGLALVLALEEGGYESKKIAALLVGTALGISLAGLFSESISLQARRRASLTRDDRQILRRETIAEFIGCAFPAIFFILSWIGLMQEPSAFRIAKWTGLGLVIAYAYLAARLVGRTRHVATMHAISAGLVGLALIELKALLH